MCMMHPGNTPWDTLPPGGTVTTTHKAAPPAPEAQQTSIGTAMALPPPATITLGQTSRPGGQINQDAATGYLPGR